MTLKFFPSDDTVRNNLVMLWLLTGTNTDRAIEFSRTIWTKSPQNRVAVSTRAFSLYTAGRVREALQLMETLPEKELRNPTVAAYYGILLVEQRLPDKAHADLDLAREIPLLPEEKALVTRARRKANLP